MSRRLTWLVTAVLLGACGGGGDGPTAPPVVASIAVAGATSSLASLGESLSLTVTAKSAKGAVISAPTISWASSNDAVATVSGGVVTASGNGNATISASSGSVSGQFAVTVQQSVAQVVIAVSTDTVRALGDTLRIAASARDARANAINGKTVVWASLSPSVLTIDPSGLMTAVAEGAATVTATIDAQSAQHVVQVRQRASKLVISRQPNGARAGVALTTQPVVQVQDSRGNLITGDNATVVTATIASGGGTIASGATATANAGVAAFSTLTLGGLVGAKSLQFAGATVGTITSSTLTLAAGNAASVVVASGNGQSVLANSPSAQPLVAGVRDAFGNAVSTTPVAFTVMQGGGTLAPTQTTTDANGNASAVYTPGRAAGAASVRATSSAVASAQADFGVTVLPNGVIRGTITVLPFNVSADVGSAVRRSTLVSSARQQSTKPHRRLVSAPGSTWTPTFASKALVSAPSVSPTPPTPLNTGEYVPGELLVTYFPEAVGAPATGVRAFAQRSVVQDVSTAIRQALSISSAESVVAVAAISPAILTARVRVVAGVSEDRAIAQLQSDPRVRSVERNGIVRAAREVPTQLESYLLGVFNDDGWQVAHWTRLLEDPHASAFPTPGNYPDNSLFVNQSWHYNMMDLPSAWQITQGNSSVLVAVVDDGIRFDHPAMAGVLTNDGYDFVPVGTVAACAGGTTSTNGDGDGPDADPTQPSYVSFNNAQTCVFSPEASGNHGLHVAGTIGASRVNTTGVIGVNWNVKIRPVRVLGVHGSGSNFTVAQGVLYAAGLPADNGAGGTVTPSGPPARVINLSLGGGTNSVALQTAISQAQAAGALIVAAAGNNNSSAAFYPAAYPGVISVSALGPTLNRASYSNFGAGITVAAPGGQTSAGTTHGVTSSTWNYQTNVARTDSWQGTSMATPHVTGLAALILSQEPSLTATQLRQRIVDYSVDLGIPGRDDTYGAGLVSARNSIAATTAPPRRLFVRLLNANTGTVVATVLAPNGSYEFAGLSDGRYWVFAGEDENGDGLTGLPGRSWGTLGFASDPTAVVVSGADIYPATFSVYRATEFEQNGSADVADELLVDGYMQGDLTSLADVDFYRVRVTQAGTYTIQVTGQSAACRYALEADPTLTVLSSTGSSLASADDIDVAKSDYCARLSVALTPGDVYVRVGAAASGRYVVSVRKQ